MHTVYKTCFLLSYNWYRLVLYAMRCYCWLVQYKERTAAGNRELEQVSYLETMEYIGYIQGAPPWSN